MTYRSRKTLRSFLAIALAAALTCAGISARAQEVTGSISGTVTAAGGGAVKGANVVLTNTDHNQVVRNVATNAKGYYVAASLPVGTYSVTITAPSFSGAVISGITVHDDSVLTVNGKLKTGSETETVATTYPQLYVNRGNATVKSTITGTQARELPLGTRNFEQLVALQPGVSYGGTVDQSNIGQSVASHQNNTAAYSIDGQRSSGNFWTIDGADNVDHGGNNTLINYPSVEAISEITTLRNNYEASSGRTIGSQINVITRSGSNDLHGSLYEFFRNDALNANNFFNKIAGVKRPELRYNDFGGTIGGPVAIPGLYDGHDKTFFFISAEVRRVIAGASTQVAEPTKAELGLTGGPIGATVTGVFGSPVCNTTNSHTGACTGPTGNTVVSNSPTAVAYIRDIFANLPAPNGVANAGQDSHNLTYNANSTDNNVQEFLRIDHKINNKATIYGHYLRDSLPTVDANGYMSPTGGLPGVNTTSTKSPSTGGFVHLSYVKSPRLLFDFGYGYTAGSIHSTPIGLNALASSPHIHPILPYQGAATPTGIVPALNFQGGTSINSVGNYNESSKNHNLFGSITRTWHEHTFVLGASVNHYEKTESEPNGSPLAPSGNYSFTGGDAPSGTVPIEQSVANFLQGVADGGFTEPSIAPIADLGAVQEEAFIQDTWKASPSLTVTFGVHYSHFLQPVDNNGRLSSFLPNSFVIGNGTIGPSTGFAPIIDNTGSICTPLQISSFPAAIGKNGLCPNGGVASQTNAGNNYDPFNGLIYSNDPSPALDNGGGGHESPWFDQIAHTDKFNLAPRFGLTWDVFGDGRTTFRMGYGVYFDNVGAGMFESAIFNNVPFVVTAQAPVAGFDNPAASTAPWQPVALTGVSAGVTATQSPYGYMPPTVWGTSDHFHTPYSQQYMIGVQRQLPYQILLDIAAVGSHDTHLLGRADINQVVPGQAATASSGVVLPQSNAVIPVTMPAGGYTSAYQEMTLNQIRPYTGYGPINMYKTGFNSNYNSLQVRVQKHFHSQSFIEANYTYSRNMTNAQGDRTGSVQNTYALAPEYGRSQFDRKQVFSLDGAYALPFFSEQEGLEGKVLGGWELTGVINMASGLPYTATTSYVDPAGLGLLAIGTVAQGRPNQVGNPNLAPAGGIHSRADWFNTSAFQLAPVCAASAPFCLAGNEHVGSINGPGIARVDVGLFRNFKVTDMMNFQFRAEAYNLLNNVNWASISTNMQSTNFGQVTSTRDPRTLQMALKLSF